MSMVRTFKGRNPFVRHRRTRASTTLTVLPVDDRPSMSSMSVSAAKMQSSGDGVECASLGKMSPDTKFACGAKVVKSVVY